MIQHQPTPVTFSPEEVREIAAAFAGPGKRLPCPRCGKDLEMSRAPTVRRDLSPMWRVDCAPCRRTAVIVEGR